MVIVAIPEKSVADLPRQILRALPEGAAVVDAGNYVPQQRDGKIEELENGTVESRWAEAHLGHPVVKALNTIRAQHLLTLSRPAGTPGRIALPVAGDDTSANAVVIRLIDQLGFDGVDAGGLDDSWRQQPGMPVQPQIWTPKVSGRLLPPQARSAPPSGEPDALGGEVNARRNARPLLPHRVHRPRPRCGDERVRYHARVKWRAIIDLPPLLLGPDSVSAAKGHVVYTACDRADRVRSRNRPRRGFRCKSRRR